MIALETTLNGQQLCIAGAEDLCVLNTIVNAVGKLGDLSKHPRDLESADLFLSVGGLTRRTVGDDEHLRWTEEQSLSVGDEITITILKVEEADLPSSRTPAKSTIEDDERYQFEQAKSLYFELRDKYEPKDNA